MSNIVNFTFENTTVRTAIKDGNAPYFCLADVLPILGLESRAVNKFNLDNKGVEKLATSTKGGKQEVTFISEPNLYRVIFRSNKKEAVKFQNWVFDEVLPSIRKTGTYTHAKTTTADRRPLVEAVNKLCRKHRLAHSDIYRMVHQHINGAYGLQVRAIDDIPCHLLGDAIAYVHMLNLAPSKKTQDDIISNNIHNLVWHTAYIYQWYKEREEAFFALSPQIASGVHDHIIAAKGCANRLHCIFELPFDRDRRLIGGAHLYGR